MSQLVGGFPISRRPGCLLTCSDEVSNREGYFVCRVVSFAQLVRLLVKHSWMLSSCLALYENSFSLFEPTYFGGNSLIVLLAGLLPALRRECEWGPAVASPRCAAPRRVRGQRPLHL